jgi:hypothetical protein
MAAHVMIVGLGGTGHRVVLRLKAALRRLPPEQAQRFLLMVFDTHMEELKIPDARTGEPIALEPEQEILWIGRLDVGRIRKRLKLHPSIAQRLPMLEDLPAITLREGAKQFRPLGALAFLWHFPRIRKKLHDALWALLDRHRFSNAADSIDLLVIVVTSLAGGTGSGMFLDMAYLIRHELGQIGDAAEGSTLILLAVGPQAFHDVTGPRLIPNTVASLMELRFWTEHGRFRQDYRDGTRIEEDAPPFDMVFYVDAIDERGRTWPNVETMATALAEAILILAATPLGRHSRGAWSNLEAVLGERTPDGELTFLGSLGTASLVFPADRIVEYLTTGRAMALLRPLLAEPDSPAAREGMTRWIQQRPWDPEALMNMALRDQNGNPLLIRLVPPAWLEAYSDVGAMMREALAYLESYEKIRVGGEFRAGIEAAMQRWLEQAVQDSQAALERLVAVYGFPTALLFLEFLQEQSAALDAALEALRQQAAREEGEARQRLRAEVQSPRPLHGETWPLIGWLIRRFWVIPALRRIFGAAESAFRLRLRIIGVEAVRAALARLRDALDRFGQDLQALHALAAETLSLLQSQAERIASELRDNPPWPELRLFDMHTLNEWQGQAGLRATPGWPMEDLRRGVTEGPAELARRLKEQLRTHFEFIYNLNLEDLLGLQPEIPPAARLEALRRLARPAWLLDETAWPGSGSLVRLEMAGVMDAAHSRFAGLGIPLVSIGDPHRMIVLTIVAGAPITALHAFPQHQRLYESARRMGHSLHTFVELPGSAEKMG